MSDDGETVPATVTVLRLDRASAGRLLAFAALEIEIAGIVIGIEGVRVLRTGPHSRGVAPPTFRGPTGESVPSVILPDELRRAIAVLDCYDCRDTPAAPPLDGLFVPGLPR